MITKLTKKQEAEIPKYIEKWVNQASVPMNHDKAIEYTRKLYKRMGQKEPLIIFGSSPMNTCFLTALFFELVKDKELFGQLYNQLNNQLYSQIDSQLNSQLNSQLDSKLYSQLYSKLGSQLRSQINNQLDNQLRSQLNSKLYSQLGSQLKKINSNWYLGVWWLVWCGWYEYSKSIGVEFSHEAYDLFINFNSEVNFIAPYTGIAFISEKPVEINWKSGFLHKNGGMSVRYADGYGSWTLNGVAVPQYLAETLENNLDLEFFKKETNADVKAEFVRKYGVERMLDFGKKIDSFENYDEYWWMKSGYELWDMAVLFPGLDYQPFLKMKNQTTGTWHVEAIDPKCRTLPEAVEYRLNGKKLKITNIK
jgi:hypothetical protein